MKNGPVSGLSPDPAAKLRELRIRISTAQRYAEGKRDETQAAKADFKRTRKAFRRVKKIAKEARKNLKSLKRALAALLVASRAARKKRQLGPVKVLRRAAPAKAPPTKARPAKKAAKKPARRRTPAPVRQVARPAMIHAPLSPPPPPAEESAAGMGAPTPPDPVAAPNGEPSPA
jgi:hypothetical protein